MIKKKLISTFGLAISLLIISIPGYTKYISNGFTENIMMGRMPNARFEAMGKTAVASNGYLYAGLINPACIGNIDRVTINYSIDPKSFYLISEDNWSSKYFGIGSNYDKFSFSFDIYKKNFGKSYFTDETGPEVIDTKNNVLNLYNFNIAYNLMQNLYIGTSLRIVNFDLFLLDKNTGYHLDFGVLKTIILYNNSRIKDDLNLGISIANFTNNKIVPDIDEHAPLNLRFGLSNTTTMSDGIIDKCILNAEIGKILNSLHEEDDSRYQVGLEVTLLKILMIRGGYYYTEVYDYGHPESNKDHLSEFTYGYGISLPLKNLFKSTFLPDKLIFDFTKLEQPNYSKNNYDFDDFYNYSITINWSAK